MESARSHYKKGNLLRTEGHDLEALHEYEYAVQLDPQFLLAKKCADFLRNQLEKTFLSFGKLHYSEGNKHDACKEYTQALAINPRSWRAHQKLGMIYHELQELSKAKHHIQEAIRLSPSHARLYCLLGRIEDYNENHKAALAAYKKAHGIDPHNKEITKHTLLSQKIYTLYEQMGHAIPSPFEGHDIASLYLEKNMPEMAITTLKKTIRKYPTDQGVLFTLANVYYGINRFKMAQRYYLKCLEVNNETIAPEEVHYRLGLTLSGMHERAAAHNAFKNVVTIAPRSRTALRAKAELDNLQARVKP